MDTCCEFKLPTPVLTTTERCTKPVGPGYSLTSSGDVWDILRIVLYAWKTLTRIGEGKLKTEMNRGQLYWKTGFISMDTKAGSDDDDD